MRSGGAATERGPTHVKASGRECRIFTARCQLDLPNIFGNHVLHENPRIFAFAFGGRAVPLRKFRISPDRFGGQNAGKAGQDSERPRANRI